MSLFRTLITEVRLELSAHLPQLYCLDIPQSRKEFVETLTSLSRQAHHSIALFSTSLDYLPVNEESGRKFVSMLSKKKNSLPVRVLCSLDTAQFFMNAALEPSIVPLDIEDDFMILDRTMAARLYKHPALKTPYVKIPRISDALPST